MKILLKNMGLSLALALICLFAVNASTQPKTSEEASPNSSITNENEEDGIGCKVYNDDGTLVAKCFICNCSNLAEQS